MPGVQTGEKELYLCLHFKNFLEEDILARFIMKTNLFEKLMITKEGWDSGNSVWRTSKKDKNSHFKESVKN